MHFARLKNHDYRGEGYYFVTFATAPRRALLSEIRAGQIRLFPEGRTVTNRGTDNRQPENGECPTFTPNAYRAYGRF